MDTMPTRTPRRAMLLSITFATAVFPTLGREPMISIFPRPTPPISSSSAASPVGTNGTRSLASSRRNSSTAWAIVTMRAGALPLAMRSSSAASAPPISSSISARFSLSSRRMGSGELGGVAGVFGLSSCSSLTRRLLPGPAAARTSSRVAADPSADRGRRRQRRTLGRLDVAPRSRAARAAHRLALRAARHSVATARRQRWLRPLRHAAAPASASSDWADVRRWRTAPVRATS